MKDKYNKILTKALNSTFLHEGETGAVSDLIARYPNYSSKKLESALDRFEYLSERIERLSQEVNEAKFKANKVSHEVYSQLGKFMDERDAIVKGLYSGDVFTNLSIENEAFISTGSEISLGDLVGRQVIGANRVRVPMDHYSDTDIAETVPEGGSATPKTLTDSLTLLVTEDTEAVIFDDILQIGEGVYNDDTETMDQAIETVHNKHFINAENKKALEILVGSKDAIAVSSEGLQTSINEKLSGKAKRNAVIITNHSGFAELDIDVNGVSQITKDPNTGDMIYKHKYTVIEISDEILPDLTAGSPVIVGDIANALRFFMIRDESVFNDAVFPYNVADRQIKKEIVTLTTKSDEAYFIGYLG